MGTSTCPGCGQEVAAGQRFCGFCGAAMARACPSCGRENPAGFRCGSCRRDLTVHGDAVNTAKRLQTAAPIGGTYVGEETYLAADLSEPRRTTFMRGLAGALAAGP